METKNLTDFYRKAIALPGELEEIDSKFDSWCYIDGYGTFHISLSYDCEIIYREKVDDIMDNLDDGYQLLGVVRGFARMHLIELADDFEEDEEPEVEFGPLVGLDAALTKIMGR